MSKINKIVVQDVDITISPNNGDYICLTDMAKAKDDEARANIIIQNWMRNRNTVEFLGVWEQLNNPNFKGIEFDAFRREAGLNTFVLTPKKWIETTNAIGIVSKSGKYGGTYAHKDIAFEFGAWISPTFKLYLITEYQRLKEIETNQYGLEWNVRRMLSKTNYQLHTDAIKNYIIPKSGYAPEKEGLAYADEADLLNMALFGCTAKQWREANMQRALAGENIRDMASINELAILSNLESLNSMLIKNGIDKQTRYQMLCNTVKEQRAAFDKVDFMKSIKKESDRTYIDKPKELGEGN